MLMFKLYMNKTNTKSKPFHLHVEYFFRKQYCLLAAMALLSVAIVKSDGKMFGVMRQAYAEGFGVIGAYLREETAHSAANLQTVRIPTHSGQ